MWIHIIAIYIYTDEISMDLKLFCHQYQCPQQFCRDSGVIKTVQYDMTSKKNAR
jgi:hypothetical protein